MWGCAFVAIVAAGVFLFAFSEFIDELREGAWRAPRAGTGYPTTPWSEHAPLLISAVTCLVSTMSSVSAMFLAWRADRRAEREHKLRQGEPKS